MLVGGSRSPVEEANLARVEKDGYFEDNGNLMIRDSLPVYTVELAAPAHPW
jgi:hypothetical protein